MQPLSFSYSVIRSNRKSLSIRITDDGVVEVRCPLFLPSSEIERMVYSKADWILKKLRKLLWTKAWPWFPSKSSSL